MRTDETLVKAAQGDDRTAFSELVERYKDRIYGFCRASLSPADAEDACQDSFVLAYSKLHSLADPRKFRPWLFTIARNQVRKKVGARLESSELELALDSPGVTPAEQLRVSSLARLVRELVAGLSDANRPVVELYYLASLNTREVAEALNLTPEVVKSRLYESRKDIKARLIRGLRDALRRELAPSDLAGRIIERCGSGCECGLIIPEKEGSQVAEKKKKAVEQTKKQEKEKSCGCGCIGKK
ncbi:MAG: RNA polymerase sigma factor [Armatimonadetes bacterium]|nr:RNA polymerase sigma factor [Armatimonadota bacterium]